METGMIFSGRAYFLDYDAQLKNYNSYLPTIQRMINSFQVRSSTSAATQSNTTTPASKHYQPNMQNETNLVPNRALITTSSLSTYENATLGIKMLYPSNWNIIKSNDGVRFTSPKENPKHYQEIVDIFVYPPSKGVHQLFTEFRLKGYKIRNK